MTSQIIRLHASTHLPQGQDPLLTTGVQPWILFDGNLDGISIPSGSDYFPNLFNLKVSPSGDGGSVDSTVYGGIALDGSTVPIMTGGVSNEPFKAVQILEPGLYLWECILGWFLDWGGVRVNYSVTHSDGFESVISFRIYLHGAENSYFGGASDSTAPQMVLTARNILSVDERATDVQVRGFAHNISGVTRTYNNSTRIGEFGMSLIQLSPNGHSNPLNR